MVTVELVWMQPGDEERVGAASALFDHPVRAEWTVRFLEQPNHHLCVAYADGSPAGFVSGVEITHPDKGTEMLLYELGVDERFRRRGIGRDLCRGLIARARDRGCAGVWVPVDHDDEPALALYRSLSPDEESPTAVIWWDLAGR